jgi:predicted DCC family thiol-disulfide oxidoreductase YuxK
MPRFVRAGHGRLAVFTVATEEQRIADLGSKGQWMQKPEFPMRVFYDGNCIVCAREMTHYRRQDRHGRLLLVDISAADFDARRYGIPLTAFMEQLHVIDARGRIYRGVEGFWAIWQAFPNVTLYGLLGRMITLPIINSCARLGYRGFARLRRYLPKKRRDCTSASCHIDHR